MSVHEQVIKHEHIGSRLDKIMTIYDASISRSQAQKLIREGIILINNQKVKPNYVCKADDVLSWFIPEESTRKIIAENIPLHVVYEDDAVIVLNKEVGMIVHPTHHQLNGTLVNALLHYTDNLGNKNSERPGIVHRLDKDTSGLMVIAKTDKAFHRLIDAFKNHHVERTYEALVHGVIEHDKGVIEAPIGRHPIKRLQMAIHDEGRYAKTHFHVLDRTDSFTHVSCQLETGRTHQIRVHMQYIQHPIVHDPLYGSHIEQEKKGQMLFASKLGFSHPVTKEWMEFSIQPPPWFEEEQRSLGFSSFF